MERTKKGLGINLYQGICHIISSAFFKTTSEMLTQGKKAFLAWISEVFSQQESESRSGPFLYREVPSITYVDMCASSKQNYNIDIKSKATQNMRYSASYPCCCHCHYQVSTRSRRSSSKPSSWPLCWPFFNSSLHLSSEIHAVGGRDGQLRPEVYQGLLLPRAMLWHHDVIREHVL